jgi:hypothetical protein
MSDPRSSKAVNQPVYKEILPISRKEAEKVFSAGKGPEVATTLVSLSFHETHWHWVLEKCLEFTAGSDTDLKAVALTCIGHLARIHQDSEFRSFIPILVEMLDDPIVGGVAEDAIEDIDCFSPEE